MAGPTPKPVWTWPVPGSSPGGGEGRLNPADEDIWTIGAQIAAARALSDLAGQLLHAAATGIEAITHERAQLNL
jgi:Domain of unknown function (DUF1876)